MMENQEKEELIEMKAEPEQGGKTYRKSFRVHLGVEVLLGVEMAYLGEPTISMKTPEDSSRVRLSLGNSRLSVEVRLGIASLRPGKEPPSADEDTCLCLGEAQFASAKLSSPRRRMSGWNTNIPTFSPIMSPFPNGYKYYTYFLT